MVKYFLLVFALCFAGFFITGCGGSTTSNYHSSTTAGSLPSTDPGKTEITIRVLNNSNNLPIDKATVTFTPTSIKTESDLSGNAVTKNMVVQQYKITTEHSLYNTDEQNIAPTSPNFAYTVKLIPK